MSVLGNRTTLSLVLGLLIGAVWAGSALALPAGWSSGCLACRNTCTSQGTDIGHCRVLCYQAGKCSTTGTTPRAFTARSKPKEK